MPDDYYPRKRSRGGCLDCRRAKVKCDEARPTCGTCARRGHVCQGYRANPTASAKEPQAAIQALLSSSSSSSASSHHLVPRDSNGHASHASSLFSPSTVLPVSPYQGLSPFPKSMISDSDRPVIQLYFNRHPAEVVLEPQFVAEMNANVLLGFHQDAEAVVDVLYCIGHTYLDTPSGNGFVVPALSRRARTLTRLRRMQNDGSQLEMMTLMILGLSAMEVCFGPAPFCQRSI